MLLSVTADTRPSLSGTGEVPMVAGMRFSIRPRHARTAFIGCAVLLLILIGSLAAAGHSGLLLVLALASGVILQMSMYHLLTESQAQVRISEKNALALDSELKRAQASQESRIADLGLLGRYGNLLLGCTDLAEALQVSQQMLSLLLPGSAGTIYPLIDGEGLAEATHLWGIHVGDTKPQASAQECWSMLRKRMHLGHSDSPSSLCSHILRPATGDSLTAACIPLTAQGESLGWIYLSAPGNGAFPKLQVAVAAADQLALALANLKLRQSLRDQSVRDPLTGLFNRRYLAESLGREIARSSRRKLPLTVLAFDLDHFKTFNDDYGHPAGDEVLMAFAKLLQSHSRGEDIACRQGGEEFVLIMPEMELSVAVRRAQDFMAGMSSISIVHEGRTLPPLTTSVGLAVFPLHGRRPDELLARADQALYEAKNRGRNQIVVAQGIDEPALSPSHG